MMLLMLITAVRWLEVEFWKLIAQGSTKMILKEMLREHSQVFALPPEARISDAAELMRQERIGSVVIVQNEIVVGIITDRDIALGVALGAATPDSLVSEIMSEDVAMINDEMTLMDVTRFFRTARVKRLPVVDSEKRLVGIVSQDDVVALLARELFDTCTSLEPKLGHMV